MESPLPKWVQFLLPFLSMAAFAIMFWHLWSDRTASAGTAAAIAFGLLLFRILPDLESIQVLGMQAKLQKRLAEADDLMKRLKRITEAQSRHTVFSLAYSGRWGGMPKDEEHGMYKRIIQELESQSFDEKVINEIAAPYLSMASRDLLAVFTNALTEVLGAYMVDYNKAITALKQASTGEENSAKILELEQALASYQISMISEVFNQSDDCKNIRTKANSLLAKLSLNDSDRSKLVQLVDDVSKRSKEIWEKRDISAETFGFIRQYIKRTTDIFEMQFPDGIAGPELE
ncbi:hypothetical protein [Ruegeria meonggei]|uniref:Uncharacterized protein n=1 Tax=Ruegeria meonggei TaxID=1446476 RepID=A0A1X6YV39_9RHOB|nr:hypothetical protein [Ruegeria meonggei]SLN31494.1 hypothetical protein RUM8411_01316 [Ruegeria meonggei]